MRLGVATIALLAVAGGAHAADPVRGQELYALCQACHTLNGEHGLGPSLQGIIGRRAGAVEGFRYSPAMRRSEVVWNATTLDRFMEDSQAVVRGNRMPFDAIADARDRADIVAYLERAK
jgi:cytochrome c